MAVHTPICLPQVTREKASATAIAETLLAHHVDRHAFFAERVVDVARGIAADPLDALLLEYARDAVRRFDFHDGRLRK